MECREYEWERYKGEEEEDGCVMSARSEVERTRSTVYGCEGPANSDGTGGVRVLVTELREVVEMRRKSDRVMIVVMALEEEVVKIMCVWFAK